MLKSARNCSSYNRVSEKQFSKLKKWIGNSKWNNSFIFSNIIMLSNINIFWSFRDIRLRFFVILIFMHQLPGVNFSAITSTQEMFSRQASLSDWISYVPILLWNRDCVPLPAHLQLYAALLYSTVTAGLQP